MSEFRKAQLTAQDSDALVNAVMGLEEQLSELQEQVDRIIRLNDLRDSDR